MSNRIEVRVPDLDMPDVPLVLGEWLADEGAWVHAGERLVEIVAGEVLVELAAPEEGILQRKVAGANKNLVTGQVVAIIHESAGESASGLDKSFG